jgi:hypothetical protein
MADTRPPADDDLATLLRERNDAWFAAQRAKSLECEVAHLREVLTHHETSVSWRLTAPIRRVGRALRPRRAAQPEPPTPTDTSNASRA